MLITAQVEQLLLVLGLLASVASDVDNASKYSHIEEAVLNVSQTRIYIVPVLEV